MKLFNIKGIMDIIQFNNGKNPSDGITSIHNADTTTSALVTVMAGEKVFYTTIKTLSISPVLGEIAKNLSKDEIIFLDMSSSTFSYFLKYYRTGYAPCVTKSIHQLLTIYADYLGSPEILHPLWVNMIKSLKYLNDIPIITINKIKHIRYSQEQCIDVQRIEDSPSDNTIGTLFNNLYIDFVYSGRDGNIQVVDAKRNYTLIYESNIRIHIICCPEKLRYKNLTYYTYNEGFELVNEIILLNVTRDYLTDFESKNGIIDINSLNGTTNFEGLYNGNKFEDLIAVESWVTG